MWLSFIVGVASRLCAGSRAFVVVRTFWSNDSMRVIFGIYLRWFIVQLCCCLVQEAISTQKKKKKKKKHNNNNNNNSNSNTKNSKIDSDLVRCLLCHEFAIALD